MSKIQQMLLGALMMTGDTSIGLSEKKRLNIDTEGRTFSGGEQKMTQFTYRGETILATDRKMAIKKYKLKHNLK